MSETIIIYRLGSMGDCVVALPCFHKIAQAFPDARRVVLSNIPVSSKAAPIEHILGQSGLIHGVIEYPLRMRRPSALLGLSRQLRATGAKTLIHMQTGRGLLSSRRDQAFFWASGFSRILGLPSTTDDDRGRTDPATGEQEYEGARLARSLAALGPIDLDDPAMWDLRLGPEERQGAQAALGDLSSRPFIAVNTGGKDPSKDWGLERWSRLLAQLDPLGLPVVFVGAREDAERAAALAPFARSGSRNLCGGLSVRETAAVLALAKVFVGHDSGPLHLAAAVQTPVVGIYGGLNRPRKWHPHGSGHAIFHDLRGVAEISPTEIAGAVIAAVNSG